MPFQYFNKFSFREKSDGKKLVMAQVGELLLNIQQCSQTIKKPDRTNIESIHLTKTCKPQLWTITSSS